MEKLGIYIYIYICMYIYNFFFFAAIQTEVGIGYRVGMRYHSLPDRDEWHNLKRWSRKGRLLKYNYIYLYRN